MIHHGLKVLCDNPELVNDWLITKLIVKQKVPYDDEWRHLYLYSSVLVYYDLVQMLKFILRWIGKCNHFKSFINNSNNMINAFIVNLLTPMMKNHTTQSNKLGRIHSEIKWHDQRI